MHLYVYACALPPIRQRHPSTYTLAHIHTYIHTCIYINAYIYIDTCIYTNTYTHTCIYTNTHTQAYAPPLLANGIYTSGPPRPTVLHSASLGSLLPLSPASAPRTPTRHITTGSMTQHNSPHGALNTSDYMQNQHRGSAAPYSIQSPARSLMRSQAYYDAGLNHSMQVHSLNV